MADFINRDEQMIWDTLLSNIGNPYGVAAIMGNMKAESGLRPKAWNGKNRDQWTNVDEYIAAVNGGSYDQYSFAHDGIAFGIVQWLFWSRKKALHEYAKGRDIGAADVQIGYLLEELPKYKAVWPELLNATDIQTPSDLIMLKYEKPGTVTEQAKEKRRNYAQSFYDKYAKQPVPIKGRLLKTKMDRVLVRAGNGLEYCPVARIEKKDTCFPIIASSDNNWHAIAFGDDRVSWVNGEYVDILEG